MLQLTHLFARLMLQLTHLAAHGSQFIDDSIVAHNGRTRCCARKIAANLTETGGQIAQDSANVVERFGHLTQSWRRRWH